MEEITVEELAEALKILRNDKTSVRDKITMEMVKYNCYWVLNKAWKEQIETTYWERGYIINIQKRIWRRLEYEDTQLLVL